MLSATLKKRDKIQFEQGLEKGIQKGKIETAKNMLKEKMSVKKIAEITGLTVEEIEKFVV